MAFDDFDSAIEHCRCPLPPFCLCFPLVQPSSIAAALCHRFACAFRWSIRSCTGGFGFCFGRFLWASGCLCTPFCFPLWLPFRGPVGLRLWGRTMVVRTPCSPRTSTSSKVDGVFPLPLPFNPFLAFCHTFRVGLAPLTQLTVGSGTPLMSATCAS